MEKLKELVLLCKASISISVNHHRDYYESVEDHISEEERQNIDKEMFAEMIKRNTVVRIQAYPNTPIGFYLIYHYDIDKALEITLNAVKNNE